MTAVLGLLVACGMRRWGFEVKRTLLPALIGSFVGLLVPIAAAWEEIYTGVFVVMP